MPQPLVVTAAVILKQGCVLITQRLPGSRDGGLWEFPGGKLEDDESPREGLRRELREELGTDAEVGEIFDVLFHRYPWGNVLLLVYTCTLADQPVQHLGVADHRWVRPEKLSDYPFLPADIPLIASLQHDTNK